MKFCYNCGAKLIENAKFCSECGTPMTEGNDTNISEIIENSNTDKESVTFFDGKVVFGKDAIDYIKVRSCFERKGEDNRDKLIELCENKIKKLRDVKSIAYWKYCELLDSAIEEGVELLISYGIDYYDFDRLHDIFTDRVPYGCGLNEYNTEIDYIEEKKEEFEQEIENYKNSGSHWQGGGFGVKGAIKGAMTASVLNAGSSVIKSIGEGSRESKARQAIEALELSYYNSQKAWNYLIKYMYLMTKEIHVTVYDILVEEGIMNRYTMETDKAVAKTKNATRADKDGKVKLTPELFDAMYKSIEWFPYMCNICRNLYYCNTELKNEIIRLAEFLGTDNIVKKQINQMDNDPNGEPIMQI